MTVQVAMDNIKKIIEAMKTMRSDLREQAKLCDIEIDTLNLAYKCMESCTSTNKFNENSSQKARVALEAKCKEVENLKKELDYYKSFYNIVKNYAVPE